MARGIRTIEQRVSAGNDFNGALPTTPIVLGDGMEAFGEDSVGGLFDPGLDSSFFVPTIELLMGGQTAWTIHKRDRDGVEILLFKGKWEDTFITTARDTFIMTARQKLVVRTTGATGALLCRLSLQDSV